MEKPNQPEKLYNCKSARFYFFRWWNRIEDAEQFWLLYCVGDNLVYKHKMLKGMMVSIVLPSNMYYI